MKYTAVVLLASAVALGHSQAKPSAPAAKPASSPATQSTAKPGTATTKSPAAQSSAAKLPASDMPVLHSLAKPLFTERYIDTRVGTGAPAEPGKVYHVMYAGYLATTGQKFDSSQDHPVPVMKDGKPVMGADGKPEIGPPQPLVFPQGTGRLIIGFDQGLGGMRVGGKRRIFIPWQLGYGIHEIPSREGHIGIPPKSDLIFDVELVDVTEMPAQPSVSTVPRPVPTPTPQPSTPPAGTVPSTPPTGSTPPTPPPTTSTPQSSAPTAPPQ